ncbi:unnamed protein product [Rotaria sp. Silwood1]|nr:unnamed protein product [Rotaria sp. Silwood1]
MAQAYEFCTERVLQQQVHRKKRKLQFIEVVDNGSDVDTDSISDSSDVIGSKVLVDTTTTAAVNQGPDFKIDDRYFSDEDDSKNLYSPDEDDNLHIYEYDSFSSDGSLPLYERTSITTNKAVKSILNFCVDSNLDKLKLISLMHLIKSLLPVPNHLPTTFHQILKTQGKKPSSTTKLYCNKCLALTTLKGGQQFCTNSYCSLASQKLSKRQLTEVVTVNIREKLQCIIRRNISFFTECQELFPAFDISSGNRYQVITEKVVHPITFNIHVDGAPLVRSTKSSLWPCFSSIVELPPPIREFQTNILTLGFWISCVKPDVNVFLQDIIEQLIDLNQNGTSIFVNENEFKVFVKTQFFISDLPAKSLFTKTINFNGYYACTNCTTEDHGALGFTSAFCFESAIRHVKKKAHGTKYLGSQIAFWYDIDAIIRTEKFEPPKMLKILREKMDTLQYDFSKVKLYLRFKDKFITYHSLFIPQGSLKEKSLYSCIVYIDEPLKYSIVESKRLLHVNDDGYGIIKEFGKSYNIRVEQTGTQSSMERYGQLLELAMQHQMHEEVPSDCEDRKSKKEKQNRIKNSTTASTSKPMLSTKAQRQHEGDKSTVNDVDTRTYLSPSTFQSDAFDAKLSRSSKVSTQRDDRDSPSSDEDEVGEEQQLSSSSDEDDLDDLESSNFLSLQTTSAVSKKRAKKQELNCLLLNAYGFQRMIVVVEIRKINS